MQRVTQQELIKDYKQLADELKKRPTLSEYNELGTYSSTPIYKLFDSFEELKEEAGFNKGERKIPNEDLIKDLHRVADKIGRSPPVEVYDDLGEYNNKTLKRRWGNWSEVLQEAGLEPTDHSVHWKNNQPEQFEKSYGSVEVKCNYCDDTKKVKRSELDYKTRFFCDYDCRGEFMSQQTGKDARAWEGGEVEIECEWCSNVYQVKTSKVNTSRFCSQDCMIEWRSEHFSGEGHPRWEGGYDRYYGPNWHKQRRKALERDGYECQLCPVDREKHNERYDCDPVVHHITRFGDFENYMEANRLMNLITLCKRCHGLIEGGRIELPDQ